MSAPNAQPAGSRPAPKAPNTHGPHSAGKPVAGGSSLNTGHTGEKGVAKHSTPKPSGNGKANPLH